MSAGCGTGGSFVAALGSEFEKCGSDEDEDEPELEAAQRDGAEDTGREVYGWR